MNQIPIEYWNTGEAKWNSHAAFQTTNHWHVSSYEEKSCDLAIVQCENGNYYIEDNFGDAKGHDEVFNPFEFELYTAFFGSFDEVNKRTAKIVAGITGADRTSLLIFE